CNDIVFLIGQSLKLKLQESNGTINCTKLPIVMGHRSLLLQVFQNLISNALKFRKDDVAPVINIHWLEKGSFYEFRLEDNGIGIQEKHIDNIFHLFTRLNSPTDFEGSGIGLSTVQKILNLYNGDIRVESVLGEGTTFIFTLPKPGELIL
ncbi:MAG: light-regulated signal transduction histidine kinase (bacteriophytochrome), partial [Saprospiraceae bacterium]